MSKTLNYTKISKQYPLFTKWDTMKKFYQLGPQIAKIYYWMRPRQIEISRYTILQCKNIV